MEYRRSGKSGLLLPVVTLGLWHNFGTNDNYHNMVDMLHTAFDNGITSFDLANNYGPLPGAAEENFGRILKSDFAWHRDEMIITSKAGFKMWEGPYGEWGSRKYIMASINQSLRRLQLEYVDIFYSHREDPNTPLEETMQALADIVHQGKALYVGLSNYSQKGFEKACKILKSLGRVPVVYQGKFSMLAQDDATDMIESVAKNSCGYAAYSPFAQGLLTNKYLNGVPAESRAASSSPFLHANDITAERILLLNQLNDIARSRNQSLAQMSVSWLLSDKRMTSIIMGASSSAQIRDAIGSLSNYNFSSNERTKIDEITQQYWG